MSWQKLNLNSLYEFCFPSEWAAEMTQDPFTGSFLILQVAQGGPEKHVTTL